MSKPTTVMHLEETKLRMSSILIYLFLQRKIHLLRMKVLQNQMIQSCLDERLWKGDYCMKLQPTADRSWTRVALCFIDQWQNMKWGLENHFREYRMLGTGIHVRRLVGSLLNIFQQNGCQDEKCWFLKNAISSVSMKHWCCKLVYVILLIPLQEFGKLYTD